MRTVVATLVACSVLAGFAHGTAAQASMRMRMSIPAQDLGSALQALASERKLYFIYASQDVLRRRSEGARGDLTLDEALSELLHGTDLTYQFIDEGTVSIMPASAATTSSTTDGAGLDGQHSLTSENMLEAGYRHSFRIAQAEAADVSSGANASAAPNPSARDTADNGALEEVVVTSRRREESIQDIPTSITALTPRYLEEHTITTTEQLGQVVPNVHIDQGQRSGTEDISIRGVTPVGTGGDPDSNPAVGQYINGIYVGERIGNVTSTLDVERIEVLRGPQGTLFGKNTTAGAINIITHRPTAEASSEVMLRTGSHDRQDGSLIVNAPLSDTFFARVAVGQTKQDGYYHNLLLHTDNSDVNLHQYTGSLRWVPNDEWTFDFITSYQTQDENNRGGTCEFYQVTSNERLHEADGGGNLEDACLRTQNAGRYNYYADTPQFLHTRAESQVLSFAWRGGQRGVFDTLDVSGNIGHRASKYNFLIDGDLTSEPLSETGATGVDPQGQNTKTAELIADGTIGPADILVGYSQIDTMGYFGNQKDECYDDYATVVGTGQSVTCQGAYGFYLGNLPLNAGNPGPHPTLESVRAWSDSEGLFTHIKYKVSDWFRVEAGARYTRETRQYFNIEAAVDPAVYYRTNSLVLNDTSVDLFGEGKATWSKVTPTASLNFTLPGAHGFLDEGLGYLLWSRGFQSGGFNIELPVKQVPALAPLQKINPETLDNYELGIKTTMFDRRLRFNLAVFHMIYSNKQETINIDNGDGRYGPNAAIQVTQNAAKLNIDGFELEFQGRLPAGFSVDGGLATQKPKFVNYTVLDPQTGLPVDLSKTPYNVQPRTTFNGNLNWGHALPIGGNLGARLGVYWQASQDLGATTLASIESGAQTQCYQKAYANYNAKVDWTNASDHLNVAVSARNLTNHLIMDSCSLSLTSQGFWHPYYEDARTWALEATYRFHQ